jgi:hypothetical protein
MNVERPSWQVRVGSGCLGGALRSIFEPCRKTPETLLRLLDQIDNREIGGTQRRAA